MADKEKPQPPQTDAVAPAAPELNNPDFQFVLKALLAAYQPILEQQLNLAKDPEALQKEAQHHPPTAPTNSPWRMPCFENFSTRTSPSECFHQKAESN
jgi:hypothetical protein